MQRTFITTLLIGWFTLALGACLAPPIDPLPTATQTMPVTRDATPSILRVGWNEGPDTLHPGLATTFDSLAFFDLVYDSLYQLQIDGTITPELATDAQVSDDGLVWIFTLRDNVTWHDGAPLTAQDVAYSLNLYRQMDAFTELHPRAELFADVEAQDDSTIVLTLNEIVPDVESRLLDLYILPEHVWGSLQDEALLSYDNRELIGSGPFQLVDYREGDFVHLAANLAYYGARPTIDEIRFLAYHDSYAALESLRQGNVDLITDLPEESVPGLRTVSENITVVTGPPMDPLYLVPTIAFNQIAPDACPPATGPCTGHPALQDHTVRRALAHATDKEELINVMGHGMAGRGLTLISDSSSVWFNDTLQDHAYDPALANAMLDDAGYLDKDSDGVREMPNSDEPLVLRLNWPSRAAWAGQVVELVAEMWGKVGVAVEQKSLNMGQIEAVCCPPFDYDVMMWGWHRDPDPQFLLSVMSSGQIASGLNETGYANPAYDALFAQQTTTRNPVARREIVWEMQRLVHENVVYIVPFYGHAIQAYRTDRFTGWITDAPTLGLTDISSLLMVEAVK